MVKMLCRGTIANDMATDTNVEYELTAGIEVHAELATASKMFCGCKNNPFVDEPNIHTCPVCMGHPGTLPVPNKEAVLSVLRVGSAIGGTLADLTEFDRKNYFYPDIPKGYQISQHKHPLVTGGVVGGVAVTRIHLEEDTATSIHDRGDFSLVDYNRAGVPLMELVTEPVITSAEQAGRFGRELQLLLRVLGVSNANMEKGEMRVEVNISVAPVGARARGELGDKVEVKNLNSFRSVERSVAYEFERQVAIFRAGGKVDQETRGFDESTNATFSQRKKESSHDYRYFPEPDIPKLRITQIEGFSRAEIDASLPELPDVFRARCRGWELKSEQVETLLFDAQLLELFNSVTNIAPESLSLARLTANYITSDLVALLKISENKIPTKEAFYELVCMIDAGDLSSRGAKDTLAILVREGGMPRAIAEREGLIQKDDPAALAAMVAQIVADNAAVAAEFKAGKEASLQFLVGQGMKLSKGSANPGKLREALIQAING
jgi:aspartyl-tRNA(Asn)/glutamyl-tRNA(Gln) amidotransferase subunit B